MATKRPTKKPKPTKKPPFDEKKFFTWLRSGLRNMSRRFPSIYEALADAKEPYVGENPRQRFAYRCAACDGLFAAKGVAVDHRIDCGSLASWQDVQGFIQRLFCTKEGLDILCHTCHDAKTYSAKHNVSLEEAKVAKAVLAFLKDNTTKKVVAYLNQMDYNDTSNLDKRRKALTEIYTKELSK